jgi:pimeloyl-ACP methyl ester carboxylesterase
VSVVVSYESPLTWIDWWPRRGPGGGPSLEDERPEVAAERFMRRVAGDEVWEALPASTRRRRLDEGRTLVAELASVGRAAPYVPAEIVVPTLVARGSDTDEHRRRAAALLAEEIPGAELVVLEGADHGAHTARPEAVAALVRRSLLRSGRVGTAVGWGAVSDSRPVNLSASGPPETVLPTESAEARHRLEQAMALAEPERRSAVAAVVAANPRWSAAWAALGDCGRDDVEAYAAYRVGYHRGLDSLRANGWRGSGYVRWQHPSNQGFLMALAGLARQAAAIGELDEAERCELFLRQCDPSWPPPELAPPPA